MTPAERRWRPPWPVDLATTLGPLCRGRSDPSTRLGPDGVWRATRTPQGPATLRLTRSGDEVLAHAWGPGAEFELAGLPHVLGSDDDPTGFDADAHPVMSAAHRRFGAGWRAPRTGRVLEALVPAILEQRVTGREARRAWARLVAQHGEPAPGPELGLVVPRRASPSSARAGRPTGGADRAAARRGVASPAIPAGHRRVDGR